VIYEEGYDGRDLGCVACHGLDGQSTAFKAIDPTLPYYSHSSEANIDLTLSDYLSEWMPQGATGACVGECADDLAAYIRSWELDDEGPLACDTSTDGAYGMRQMRLLTIREYQNSLFDLTGYEVDASLKGVPQDTFVDGFANQIQTAVTLDYADAYATIAREAADFSAANNFAGIANCGNLNASQCGQAFVDDFAPRVFRRPLTSVESDRYLALFADRLSEGSADEGLKLAVETILSSPYFLFRSEMGVAVTDLPAGDRPDGVARDTYVLTQHELATFLAYTYTGSTPDNALLQAAQNNQLSTDQQVLAQIDRLLATPRAREHFGEFAAQWLRTDRVISRNKDEVLFPDFTTDIRTAMAQEVREIFRHVMFDGSQSIDELYGDFTFVNRDLADYYGLSGNFGNGFTKVDGLADRGGILTSGAFMAGFANVAESSPIQRAVAVREDMMCLEVPPMPNDIGDERLDVADALQEFIDEQGAISNRERTHFLTKDAPCSTCHETIINPHGFGMEDFDAAGLSRVVDANGIQIDPSGELIGLTSLIDGQVETFNGAKELSGVLKDLPATRSCFAEKSFRFVVGSGHDVFDHSASPDSPGYVALSDSQKESYACSLEAMEQAMSGAGYNPRAALRTIGVRDIIRYRK